MRAHVASRRQSTRPRARARARRRVPVRIFRWRAVRPSNRALRATRIAPRVASARAPRSDYGTVRLCSRRAARRPLSSTWTPREGVGMIRSRCSPRRSRTRSRTRDTSLGRARATRQSSATRRARTRDDGAPGASWRERTREGVRRPARAASRSTRIRMKCARSHGYRPNSIANAVLTFFTALPFEGFGASRSSSSSSFGMDLSVRCVSAFSLVSAGGGRIQTPPVWRVRRSPARSRPGISFHRHPWTRFHRHPQPSARR